MKQRPRIYYTQTQKAMMWERWKKGESLHQIAQLFDRNHSSIQRILAETGGIRPAERRRSRLALSLAEREEISRSLAAGHPIRSIAALLNRAPSTISREINRNGGQEGYRASQADQAARDRAHRPKSCKLVTNPALARLVASKLQLQWSPEQIAGWLKKAYPGNEDYQVSHEIIYRSLYIIAHVCELTGLHWETVRRIDRARLQATVDALPLPEPTRLVMDEFALYKGHRYATVVLDADTWRVLWVGEGRSREAIRPFFEWLGKARCSKVEAVAMDMNTAFDLEVQRHCPKARVVYDLFHVIAKYGREVIDRVRVDEANRLREDRPQRKVIKQARWLLLRNQENLHADGKARLQELLNANAALMTVYVMKAALKDLWEPVGGKPWRHAWRTWLAQARESGIEPLRRFADRLAPYWRGILARMRWPMHTGQLEGINNRIKVMKRMAYGYRDTCYFFLKSRPPSPEIREELFICRGPKNRSKALTMSFLEQVSVV